MVASDKILHGRFGMVSSAKLTSTTDISLVKCQNVPNFIQNFHVFPDYGISNLLPYESQSEKTSFLTYVPNEDSNQPAHPCSLFRVCCPHEEILHSWLSKMRAVIRSV